jgi:hypothetical protein
MAIICLLVASCQVGKQPVRRKVKMIDNKSYGIITVDTSGGKYVATPTTKPAPPSGKPVENTAGNINKGKQQVIDKLMPLWKRGISFNTFSGKAKMHYAAQGQKNEFTANIRIKNNEAIWVLVTALGGMVPVARVYITPDSILLVNNLQKDAYRMHIRDANKLLPVPVDFKTMQSLIIGNVFNTEGTATDATEFGGSMSLQVEHADIIQQITYGKADSNMRTLQMRTKDNTTQGMIKFGNYEDVTGRRFATSREVTISSSGAPYYLDMNFNSAEFDKPVEMPFSIPKNYDMKKF